MRQYIPGHQNNKGEENWLSKKVSMYLLKHVRGFLYLPLCFPKQILPGGGQPGQGESVIVKLPKSKRVVNSSWHTPCVTVVHRLSVLGHACVQRMSSRPHLSRPVLGLGLQELHGHCRIISGVHAVGYVKCKAALF